MNSRVVCACVRVCGVLTLTICNAMMRTAAQQNDALRCAALRCVALRRVAMRSGELDRN